MSDVRDSVRRWTEPVGSRELPGFCDVTRGLDWLGTDMHAVGPMRRGWSRQRAGALETQVLENASTENASTMQNFSQIKKVWYFAS